MWEVFAWLVERGYGDSGQDLMRRYTFDQVELLYYVSRKNYFQALGQELDMQSKAIAGRLGEVFAQVFS